MDPTGESWLRPFLDMAGGKADGEAVEIPAVLGPLSVSPCFELRVDPPRRFLKWLIEDPKRLAWPKKDQSSDSTPETQRKRQALKEEHPLVRAEALYELETCRCLPRAAWWRFEGITHVDCALLTDSTVVFIEGKRTEMGPSKKVTWYSSRNQVLRVLDCAFAYAQQTGRSHFFVVLVVERDLIKYRPERQMEIDAITSASTVEKSLPHLAEEEQAELLSHFLGTTTWQDIVEMFDLNRGCLLDNVDC